MLSFVLPFLIICLSSMFIIPAIDLIEGKCVRLTQGDYAQKTSYFDDPLDAAKLFEDHGIQRLHLVDLDGAKEKRIINHAVLEKIATKTSLIIDFGGGLQAHEDVKIAFECGAKQITGGSVAVKNKALFTEWIKTYGSDKIILGADAKDRMIAIHGWQETSKLGIEEFINGYLAEGIQYTISTDVAKDGMLQGPSLDLYEDLQKTFPKLNIIASGGVSCMKDLESLRDLGLYGVIVGKAYYEGRITLKEMAAFSNN